MYKCQNIKRSSCQRIVFKRYNKLANKQLNDEQQKIQIILSQWEFYKKGQGHLIFRQVCPANSKDKLKNKLMRVRQQKIKKLLNRIGQKQNKPQNNLKQANKIFLSSLVSDIYQEFIGIIKNDKNRKILKQVSQAIIEQENYKLCLCQQITEYYKNLSIFTLWILKSYLKHDFILEKALINTIVELNQQFCIKQIQFESNLEYHQQKPIIQVNQLSKVISFAYLHLLIEIKPKTILPDAYSQQFLQRFVRQYDQIFYRHMLNQRQTFHIFLPSNANIFIPQDINQIRKILQTYNHNEDKQYNNNEDSRYNNNKGTSIYNIQSTRWFKKNCLKGKQEKKNQDPINYFQKVFNSLTFSNPNNKTVDFYSYKNLRKIIQNINQKSEQIELNQLKNLQNTYMFPKDIRILQQIIGKTGSKQLTLIEQILAIQMLNYSQKQVKQTYQIIFQTSQCRQKKQVKFNYDILTVDRNLNILLQLLDYFTSNNIQPFQKIYVQQISSIKQQITKIQKPQKPQQKLFNQNNNQTQLFNLEIKQKSRQLNELLIQIIKQKLTKLLLKNKIEKPTQQLFILLLNYIICYLISLTWRDISIMIQIKALSKQYLQHKQEQIKLKIIDFSLKPLFQSVQVNIQKQKEFLLYYWLYCKQNKLNQIQNKTQQRTQQHKNQSNQQKNQSNQHFDQLNQIFDQSKQHNSK